MRFNETTVALVVERYLGQFGGLLAEYVLNVHCLGKLFVETTVDIICSNWQLQYMKPPRIDGKLDLCEFEF